MPLDIIGHRNQIKAGLSKQLVESESWCIFSASWFEKWKRYVNFGDTTAVDTRSKLELESLHPGQIDNSSLADESNMLLLKKGIVEGQDYILSKKCIFYYR